MSSSKTIHLWQLFQTVSKSMFKIDSLWMNWWCRCGSSESFDWIGQSTSIEVIEIKNDTCCPVKCEHDPEAKISISLHVLSISWIRWGNIYIYIKTFKKTFKKPSFTVASDYRISPANQWFNDLRWYPIKDK